MLTVAGRDVAPIYGIQEADFFHSKRDYTGSTTAHINEKGQLVSTDNAHQNDGAHGTLASEQRDGLRWARIDLSIPHLVRGVVIHSSLDDSARTTSVKLQYSTDGLNFAPILQPNSTHEMVC